VGDSFDLGRAKISSRFELEGHGGGRLPLLADEERILRQGDVHPALLDLVETVDGSRQLALERPAIVQLLLEFGGAERLDVEDLETDAAALGQSGSGHFQPQLGDLPIRHGNRIASCRDPVGDLLFLQAVHDLTGVFAGEIRKQHAVLDRIGEEYQRGDSGKGQRSRRHHRHLPDGGQRFKTLSKSLKKLREGIHESNTPEKEFSWKILLFRQTAFRRRVSSPPSRNGATPASS